MINRSARAGLVAKLSILPSVRAGLHPPEPSPAHAGEPIELFPSPVNGYAAEHGHRQCSCAPNRHNLITR